MPQRAAGLYLQRAPIEDVLTASMAMPDWTSLESQGDLLRFGFATPAVGARYRRRVLKALMRELGARAEAAKAMPALSRCGPLRIGGSRGPGLQAGAHVRDDHLLVCIECRHLLVLVLGRLMHAMACARARASTSTCRSSTLAASSQVRISRMTYTFMACIAMARTVMADILMADVVMADIVMAG